MASRAREKWTNPLVPPAAAWRPCSGEIAIAYIEGIVVYSSVARRDYILAAVPSGAAQAVRCPAGTLGDIQAVTAPPIAQRFFSQHLHLVKATRDLCCPVPCQIVLWCNILSNPHQQLIIMHAYDQVTKLSCMWGTASQILSPVTRHNQRRGLRHWQAGTLDFVLLTVTSWTDVQLEGGFDGVANRHNEQNN